MSAPSIELPLIDTESGGKPAGPAGRLAALAGVKADLTVVAGHATAKIGELLALKEGTVMTLDTALNAPFDVMLGDQVVARGELVAVGDQFGVRITEVAPHGTP
ncbi:MAG TPA: FliM/FliN family flagellar motor switch protein [Roseateles sp.]